MKSFLKALAVIAGIMVTVCLVLAAVCIRTGLGMSEGRFYRAENGSTLLLDEHGATVLSAQHDGMFEKMNNGDKILVVHDGIEESYPARTGAYYCVRLEKGSAQDLPETVMTTLQELGWVTQVTEPEPVPDIGYEIPFSAQYIRTNGDGADIPSVTVVTTAEQLQSYYEKNKDKFNLERKAAVYADTTIGFLDACDQYDKSFFADHKLIIVTLEEGSGSIRHEVLDVTANAVYVQSIVPEVGNCDMAQWHILIAVPAEMSFSEDISVILDGKDITEEYTVATSSGAYGNISLNIPEGWEYEISTSTEKEMSFGISFWPASEESGKIAVTFMGNSWGVCGTGLREEQSVIGNYSASIGYYGYYDSKTSAWDYIFFQDLPGAYVVQMQGEVDWWPQYGEKVMEILSTIRLAEGFITESTAVSAAIGKLGGGEYKACEDVWVSCDLQNGVWRVEFYKNSSEHATVSVAVDFSGNVLEVSE